MIYNLIFYKLKLSEYVFNCNDYYLYFNYINFTI